MYLCMSHFIAVSLKLIFGKIISLEKSGKFYFLGNKEYWRFRVR